MCQAATIDVDRFVLQHKLCSFRAVGCWPAEGWASPYQRASNHSAVTETLTPSSRPPPQTAPQVITLAPGPTPAMLLASLMLHLQADSIVAATKSPSHHLMPRSTCEGCDPVTSDSMHGHHLAAFTLTINQGNAVAQTSILL